MSEANCKIICSRGILKSCDFYSYEPTSSISTLDKYPTYSPKIFKGINHFPIIHVCADAFNDFLNKLFPYINHPFILVTNDSDLTVPYDLFTNTAKFNNFINSRFILHWYSQNLVISHNKMTRIPIGLDYHTMARIDQISPISQEELLLSIKDKSPPFWERKIKCHGSFQHNMVNKYCYDRRDAINGIPRNCIDYQQNLPRNETWENQSIYSFVVSPHGNGYDCHRTWESLILGCIVIVKKSGLDELYRDLPVLIVNEWSDINMDLLESTVENFKIKQFNYNKLLLKYWVDKIRYNK